MYSGGLYNITRRDLITLFKNRNPKGERNIDALNDEEQSKNSEANHTPEVFDI